MLRNASVPLREISVQDLVVVLQNLSFASLVNPFLRNGVTGKAQTRVGSHNDIMNIDRDKISKVVAQSFYEDHVLEWKATGLVLKKLLQNQSSSTSQSPRATTIPNTKVGRIIRCL